MIDELTSEGAKMWQSIKTLKEGTREVRKMTRSIKGAGDNESSNIIDITIGGDQSSIIQESKLQPTIPASVSSFRDAEITRPDYNKPPIAPKSSRIPKKKTS